jgi:hypothetical protein
MAEQEFQVFLTVLRELLERKENEIDCKQNDMSPQPFVQKRRNLGKELFYAGFILV